jgi:hypothetical protein
MSSTREPKGRVNLIKVCCHETSYAGSDALAGVR